ncbi:DUF2075 domain-containing protein [Candidatus Saccharibacteria bacterium]|nr:DUF2075 domain-containing protein [Candidatus Saccharibacteria bacterium]
MGSTSSGFAVELEQNNAWRDEITILKSVIPDNLQSSVFMEFDIPRMGHRIDALLLGPNFPYVLVLEFKVGATHFNKADINQVYDYALELKNFHKGSHDARVIPILIATNASDTAINLKYSDDGVAEPACVNLNGLRTLVHSLNLHGFIDADEWERAPYQPTPTIIEAARALYGNQRVRDITRSEGGSRNIEVTSGMVSDIIADSMNNSKKTIIFVTGVPGAGKTLVGLNIANQKRSEDKLDHAVFLSGNGPLVEVLQEALARDEVSRGGESGRRVTKSDAKIRTKAFIQNIHHFRDQALIDNNPPSEHVVIFDEAQRAWDKPSTVDFMKRKKGHAGFEWSESEYLISYMDRHRDWAVIVCLVGGGQEINKGEAGIAEWIESVKRSYPDWHVAISDRLQDSEYALPESVDEWLDGSPMVAKTTELHLAVSMRSFRAEKVSNFVKSLLDLDKAAARGLQAELSSKYPIYVTRDLAAAKSWVRSRARGTERYGMVASSKAMRLKPFAIDVASDAKPIHYFLDSEEDVRSSYFLEAVATEFQVQGLELDWALVGWDADLRLQQGEWSYHDFRGKKWQNVNKPINREYLKNAYRVLLTRARQGMVIFVPHGNYPPDTSRQSDFYDETFEYLRSIGLSEIETSNIDLGY